MTAIFWMLLVIALLCGVIAVLEIGNGHLPAALAFFGFGIGYVGLSWLYVV